VCPATFVSPAGTAGGEAQQADITQLLKELELKKAKLNELRGDSRKAEADIAKIRDDDTDAQRLTPDGCVVENNYIQVPGRASTAAWKAAAEHAGMTSWGLHCKLAAGAGAPAHVILFLEAAASSETKLAARSIGVELVLHAVLCSTSPYSMYVCCAGPA
jgi:hypothetical protein